MRTFVFECWWNSDLSGIMMNMEHILSFITRLKATADKWLLHTVPWSCYTIILATPANVSAKPSNRLLI